jgi:hypothetical protein
MLLLGWIVVGTLLAEDGQSVREVATERGPYRSRAECESHVKRTAKRALDDAHAIADTRTCVEEPRGGANPN